MAVDPYGARLDPPGEAMRRGEGPGPDAGCQPVDAVIGGSEHVFGILEPLDREHRAEYLLAHDIHLRTYVGDDGGTNERSGRTGPFAARHHRGSLRSRAFDESLDPFGLSGRYERAHVRRR